MKGQMVQKLIEIETWGTRIAHKKDKYLVVRIRLTQI